MTIHMSYLGMYRFVYQFSFIIKFFNGISLYISPTLIWNKEKKNIKDPIE